MGKKVYLLRQKVPLPTAKCDLLLSTLDLIRRTEEERWCGTRHYLTHATQKDTHPQRKEQRVPRGDKHPLPDRHQDLPVPSLPDFGPKTKTTGAAQRGAAASPARLPAPLRRSPACTPSRQGDSRCSKLSRVAASRAPSHGLRCPP